MLVILVLVVPQVIQRTSCYVIHNVSCEKHNGGKHDKYFVANMTNIVLSADIRIHFVANMKPMSTRITLLTQSGRHISYLVDFLSLSNNGE